MLHRSKRSAEKAGCITAACITAATSARGTRGGLMVKKESSCPTSSVLWLPGASMSPHGLTMAKGTPADATNAWARKHQTERDAQSSHESLRIGYGSERRWADRHAVFDHDSPRLSVQLPKQDATKVGGRLQGPHRRAQHDAQTAEPTRSIAVCALSERHQLVLDARELDGPLQRGTGTGADAHGDGNGAHTLGRSGECHGVVDITDKDALTFLPRKSRRVDARDIAAECKCRSGPAGGALLLRAEGFEKMLRHARRTRCTPALDEPYHATGQMHGLALKLAKKLGGYCRAAHRSAPSPQ